MKKTVIDNYLILVLLLIIIGLYVGISIPIVVVAIIFFLLYKTNKHTAGFYLLMYGGVIGGVVRTLYPFIPLYGLLLNVAGLFLIRDLINEVLLRNKLSIIALVFTFVVLGLSYCLGPQTEFSTTKLLKILQNGLFFLFAYFTLDRSPNFQGIDTVFLLLYTSVFLVSFSESYYNIAPSNIFDFSWFRNGLSAYEYVNHEDTYISYQEVGMDATYAFALLLAFKKRPRGLFLLSAVAIFITLLSGARQSLGACIVVVFLRYAYFNDAKSFKRVLLLLFSCAFLGIVYKLLLLSNIDTITNTLESGDEERNYIWLLAIKLFTNNQLFGIGLGAFADYYPENPWPHNIILEILCECGLFGFISLILIISIYLAKQRVSIKHMTHTGLYYFLTLVPLMFRIMVSTDLRLSISIFCAVFATTELTFCNKKRYEKL